MRIKEALSRQAPEDLIAIGDLLKRTHNGQYGEVFRAMVNGLITECLTYHQQNPNDRQPLSAERILGRAEGYQTILDKIDLAIQTAEELQTPIDDD